MACLWLDVSRVLLSAATIHIGTLRTSGDGYNKQNSAKPEGKTTKTNKVGKGERTRNTSGLDSQLSMLYMVILYFQVPFSYRPSFDDSSGNFFPSGVSSSIFFLSAKEPPKM